MAERNTEKDIKPQYQWVDILKFFFCVCIIAMHTPLALPGRFWAEKIVFRLGVPFFFAASGFFLSKSCKSRGVGTGVKRYCLRLFQLLWVFSIVWIIQYAVDGLFIREAGIGRTALEILQRILFEPQGALWYIQASLIGALMLIPYLKRNQMCAAVVLGIVLYIFAEMCNNYYFAVEGTPLQPIMDSYLKYCLTSNNGVLVGFLFLALGVCVEQFRLYERTGLVRILLIVGMVVYIAEIAVIRPMQTETGDGAFYFTQVLIAPMLLAAVIPLPQCIASERAVLLRNLSTGMYLLHMPIMWCYNRFADYILPHIPVLRHASGLVYFSYTKFAVVLLLSMAICLLAYRRPQSFICKVLK